MRSNSDFKQPFLKKFLCRFLILLLLVCIYPKNTFAWNTLTTIQQASDSVFNFYLNKVINPLGNLWEGIFTPDPAPSPAPTKTIPTPKQPSPSPVTTIPPKPIPTKPLPTNSVVGTPTASVGATYYVTNNPRPLSPERSDAGQATTIVKETITRGSNSIDTSNFVSISSFDNQVNALLTSIENTAGGLSDSLAKVVKTITLTVTGNGSIQGTLGVTGNLDVSGTITGNVAGTINPSFTLGSVPFQGASGLAQDNANFSFNDTTNILSAAGFSGPLTGNVTGNVSGNAGTVTTNANLTGPITSVGNATSVASQTGTGTTFVMNTSPTLVTPILGVATATSINSLTITTSTGTLTIANGKTLTASNTLTFTGTDSSSVAFGAGGTVLYSGGALGTPSSGVATNLTGTASGLTAGNVTTNANLTGHITSVGNAAVLGSFTSSDLLTAVTNETGTG